MKKCPKIKIKYLLITYLLIEFFSFLLIYKYKKKLNEKIH